MMAKWGFLMLELLNIKKEKKSILVSTKQKALAYLYTPNSGENFDQVQKRVCLRTDLTRTSWKNG